MGVCSAPLLPWTSTASVFEATVAAADAATKSPALLRPDCEDTCKEVAAALAVPDRVDIPMVAEPESTISPCMPDRRLIPEGVVPAGPELGVMSWKCQ